MWCGGEHGVPSSPSLNLCSSQGATHLLPPVHSITVDVVASGDASDVSLELIDYL